MSASDRLTSEVSAYGSFALPLEQEIEVPFNLGCS